MKTSRTLLCGYSKPFVFFVLFAMGTIVATTVASEESAAIDPQSVTPTATTERKEDAKMTPSPGNHSEFSETSPEGSNPPANLTSKETIAAIGSQSVNHTATAGQKENAEITPSPGKRSKVSVASPKGTNPPAKSTSSETTTIDKDALGHNILRNNRCSSDACTLGINSIMIILLLSLRI